MKLNIFQQCLHSLPRHPLPKHPLAIHWKKNLFPYNLINILKPDVLTKGGDYKKNDIVGNQLINEEHGEVVIIPLTQGYSTTSILEKIKNE